MLQNDILSLMILYHCQKLSQIKKTAPQKSAVLSGRKENNTAGNGCPIILAKMIENFEAVEK